VSYKDAPPLTDKWGIFRACRAKMCLASWRKHTSDPWLLKNLHGYKLEFTQLPQQTFENHEIRFSTTESAFLAQEIDTLLTKGVIVQSQDEVGQFVSNVFLRPKKETGKFRMIFNLIKLNEFVEYQHFKMETLETALKMVTKDAFMASLDFTDAYYTLPVHESHQHFLKFRFQGRLYKYVSVPMGLSSACRYFTKVLKVPLSVLREKFGVAITGYIDDTFLVDPSFKQCCTAIKASAHLFQDLGFMINFKKSVLEPVQQLEYLGFIINSKNMTVRPTVEKITKLKAAVRKLQKKDVTTIRHVAQVLGGLMATHPGNPWAPLFTKQLEIDKNLCITL
jgi:hypothetical protein